MPQNSFLTSEWFPQRRRLADPVPAQVETFAEKAAGPGFRRPTLLSQLARLGFDLAAVGDTVPDEVLAEALRAVTDNRHKALGRVLAGHGVSADALSHAPLTVLEETARWAHHR
jgi:hypothetical protein